MSDKWQFTSDNPLGTLPVSSSISTDGRCDLTIKLFLTKSEQIVSGLAELRKSAREALASRVGAEIKKSPDFERFLVIRAQFREAQSEVNKAREAVAMAKFTLESLHQQFPPPGYAEKLLAARAAMEKAEEDLQGKEGQGGKVAAMMALHEPFIKARAALVTAYPGLVQAARKADYDEMHREIYALLNRIIEDHKDTLTRLAVLRKVVWGVDQPGEAFLLSILDGE